MRRHPLGEHSKKSGRWGVYAAFANYASEQIPRYSEVRFFNCNSHARDGRLKQYTLVYGPRGPILFDGCDTFCIVTRHPASFTAGRFGNSEPPYVETIIAEQVLTTDWQL